MRTAHLFAGVGGGMLADLILGHTPVLAVEQDPYCCDTLRDRIDDGWYPGLEIAESDIRAQDFAPWRGRVDCIAAGFPCQDISAAGRGAGLSGERSGLFFEVMRAVDAIRPGLVFLENSPNIRTRGRHIVTAELVARGYRWRDGKIGAIDVGAGHRRVRWFCLAANADGLRQLESERRQRTERRRVGNSAECTANVEHLGCEFDYSESSAGNNHAGRYSGGRQTNGTANACAEDVAHPDGERQQERIAEQSVWQRVVDSCCGVSAIAEQDRRTIAAIIDYCGIRQWSPFDGDGCGVVDGLSAKLHRIKALGNAQVPLQAAAAWVALSR